MDGLPRSPEAALSRTRRNGRTARTVFAAVALGALATSAGFAADRVLRAEPTGSISIKASPTPGGDRNGTPPAHGGTAANTSRAVPPLKPVQGEKASPRRITRSRSSAPASPSPGAAVSTATKAEDTVIQLTNKARATAGCAPLRFDSRLRTAARRHSTDMGLHDYFSHTSPDGDTFADRIEAAGYPHPGAENIARGYQTAAEVMDGWMDSPGHRANILNCGLRTIGVGVYYGPGGPWWTQDFGWP
ncbi:MAG TPA: CAP domain-containing protein [Streptosporangiaceae bacterium]|nr:CAP domain-containing protein [Streptosporangiaceae bacterium]